MLKSLREALAQYAWAKTGKTATESRLLPSSSLSQQLVESLEEAETHLRNYGFDPARLGTDGLQDRIASRATATPEVLSLALGRHARCRSGHRSSRPGP